MYETLIGAAVGVVVNAVIAPPLYLQPAGDAVGELVNHFVHSALGDTFLATWIAESAANVVFTPVFAVAVVLLTLDLIAAKDGA